MWHVNDWKEDFDNGYFGTMMKKALKYQFPRDKKTISSLEKLDRLQAYQKSYLQDYNKTKAEF